MSSTSEHRQPHALVVWLLLAASIAIAASGGAIAKSRQGVRYRPTVRKADQATYRLRLTSERLKNGKKSSADAKVMIDESVESVTTKGAALTETLTFDRGEAADKTSQGYALTAKSTLSRAGIVTSVDQLAFDDSPMFDLIWPQALHAVLPAGRIRVGATWQQSGDRVGAVSIDPVRSRIRSRLVRQSPERLEIESTITTTLDLHLVGSAAQHLMASYFDNDSKLYDSDLFLNGTTISSIRQTVDARSGHLIKATGTAKIAVIAGVDIPKDTPKVSDAYSVALSIDRVSSTPKELKARAVKAAMLKDDWDTRVRLLQAWNAEDSFLSDTKRYADGSDRDIHTLQKWAADIAWGKLDGGVEVLIPTRTASIPGLLLMRSKGTFGATRCLAVLDDHPFFALNRSTSECPPLTRTMTGWYDLRPEKKTAAAGSNVA